MFSPRRAAGKRAAEGTDVVRARELVGENLCADEVFSFGRPRARKAKARTGKGRDREGREGQRGGTGSTSACKRRPATRPTLAFARLDASRPANDPHARSTPRWPASSRACTRSQTPSPRPSHRPASRPRLSLQPPRRRARRSARPSPTPGPPPAASAPPSGTPLPPARPAAQATTRPRSRRPGRCASGPSVVLLAPLAAGCANSS